MSPSPPPPPIAESEWAHFFAEQLTVTTIPSGTRAVVLSAHPDDETLGAGRLIAALHVEVAATCLSWGERCVGDELPQADVAAVRRDEWHAAMSALGATPMPGPTWPDGTLSAQVDEVTQYAGSLLQPGDVVLAPWRHDPHPDHAAAGRAAARACAAAGVPLVEYPVWAPYWSTPHEIAERGWTLRAYPTDHSAYDAWIAALECYRSQLEPLRAGWPSVVPPDLTERHPTQLIAVSP